MSAIEEKLEAPHQGQAGRARATLRQLRRRYNGPLEKWPKAPESLYIQQAVTNRLELWKLVGGQAGEESTYECVEVTP